MKYLKKYKLFENYLDIDDFKNKELDKIESVFQDLSDMMADWEDQGIETIYSLKVSEKGKENRTHNLNTSTVKIADYDNKKGYLNFNENQEIDINKYYFQLIFGFDLSFK